MMLYADANGEKYPTGHMYDSVRGMRFSNWATWDNGKAELKKACLTSFVEESGDIGLPRCQKKRRMTDQGSIFVQFMWTFKLWTSSVEASY